MGRLPADLENLKATYCYIETYIATHNIPPTVREIGRAFGLTYSGAITRLRVMDRLGWIVRDGRQQSIVLKGINDHYTYHYPD